MRASHRRVLKVMREGGELTRPSHTPCYFPTDTRGHGSLDGPTRPDCRWLATKIRQARSL